MNEIINPLELPNIDALAGPGDVPILIDQGCPGIPWWLWQIIYDLLS